MQLKQIKEKLEQHPKMKHYVLYLFFGILTVIVSIVSLWLLRIFFPQLDKNLANMVSIVIAVLFAYITNRRYVFSSREENRWKEFGKFCASRAVSAVFEVVFFWILTSWFPTGTMYELFAKGICTVFVSILNYFLSRFFVFGKQKKEEERKNQDD